MMGTPLIERAKPQEPTPADWQRYVALLEKSKPTEKDRLEFQRLLGLLKITPAEAERLEEIVQRADEIQAADVAAFNAEAAARRKIADEIGRLQLVLMYNSFPEVAAYIETRYRVRELGFSDGQLKSLYHRWPGLFGLPSDDNQRRTNQDYPDAVLRKATALGISIS